MVKLVIVSYVQELHRKNIQGFLLSGVHHVFVTWRRVTQSCDTSVEECLTPSLKTESKYHRSAVSVRLGSAGLFLPKLNAGPAISSPLHYTPSENPLSPVSTC